MVVTCMVISLCTVTCYINPLPNNPSFKDPQAKVLLKNIVAKTQLFLISIFFYSHQVSALSKTNLLK